MERADIVVKGRVQRAGYIDTIDEIAYHLNLDGFVKNQEDGSVLIVCEGERKDIEKLIEKIDIKKYPIKVRDISVEYSEARDEFEEFEIVREEDLTDAVYERMDTAARYMREMNHNLGSKVDNVSDKVENVGDKVDNVGDGVEKMHHDMNDRFDHLDDRYGEFGEKMERMDNSMEELTKQIGRLVDHIVEEGDR